MSADTSAARIQAPPIIIKSLGTIAYEPCFQAMQSAIAERDADQADELWVLEHPSVYTLGQAADRAHILRPSNSIPIIQTNRGGQVTYHGPGQLVVYTLLNLKRLMLNIRQCVHLIEQSIIQTLADYGVQAERRTGAPGVYVNDAKIAALGLRVSRGFTYHGLSLNLEMDLSPFLQINPCGYQNLAVIDLKQLVPNLDCQQAKQQLVHHLIKNLGYTQSCFQS